MVFAIVLGRTNGVKIVTMKLGFLHRQQLRSSIIHRLVREYDLNEIEIKAMEQAIDQVTKPSVISSVADVDHLQFDLMCDAVAKACFPDRPRRWAFV